MITVGVTDVASMSVANRTWFTTLLRVDHGVKLDDFRACTACQDMSRVACRKSLNREGLLQPYRNLPNASNMLITFIE